MLAQPALCQARYCLKTRPVKFLTQELESPELERRQPAPGPPPPASSLNLRLLSHSPSPLSASGLLQASVSTPVKWASGSRGAHGALPSPAAAKSPVASFLRCSRGGGGGVASSSLSPSHPPLASPSPEVTGSPAWHQHRQGFKWVSWGRKRRECDAINCAPYLLFLCQPDVPGLDGLVNNTPGRPICHRQAPSWRQLLPRRLVSPTPETRAGAARRLARPSLGTCWAPACLAAVAFDLPCPAPWPRPHFTEEETEATVTRWRWASSAAPAQAGVIWTKGFQKGWRGHGESAAGPPGPQRAPGGFGCGRTRGPCGKGSASTNRVRSRQAEPPPRLGTS